MSIISLFPAELSSMIREIRDGRLEKRVLEKTGEILFVIGFGGVVVMDATPVQESKRVLQAIDYGVSYFDVAPTYGNAELMIAAALKPFSKNVFLAYKTLERDGKV